MPILKASSLVVAHSSCCGDQGKQDQPNHDQHLGTAEPEFKFSEETNAPIINGDNCNQEKGHVKRRVSSWAVVMPILVEPESDDEN